MLLKKHHKSNISINKISDKNKRSFKTRLLSSFFIVFFILLSFTFSILSDTSNHWFPIDNISVKEVFSFIQLFFFSSIIIMAGIEICTLHFYRNYISSFSIIFAMFICYLGPGLIFIFEKFNYFNLIELDYFYILLWTSLGLGSFSIIINIICFWLQGLVEWKKITVQLILTSLVPLFGVSWLYFSDFKGWTTLLLLYGITALTDVFAYICGMFFGKRKMSPYISPNKTIGGGIGGVILTTIIAIIILICFSFIPNEYNVLANFFGIKFNYTSGWINDNLFSNSPLWWACIIFIIPILCIISMAGDLSFSYIKRTYGIKDFSNLIPGHGGILDRIDSLSFSFSSYFIFILFISLFSSTVGLF